MQTLLVPVDFSPASTNAATYAANLAKVLNAKLILFHAYMLPTPVSEVPYVMVTAEEMQKENEELISKQADSLHLQFNIEVQWLVRIGIASDEIKSLTKETEIDLVVMGMKGAGGLEKIIGSTTTNVIRKIKKPVLLIPHDAMYKTISSITYSSDFSYQTSFHLFDPLFKLAAVYNAVINILHIQLSHSGEHADIMVGRKDIEGLFKEHKTNFITLENSSVTQGIQQYLQKNNTDILVMVAHAHSFFERIFTKTHTTAMAYESHIPMLVLQDKA